MVKPQGPRRTAITTSPIYQDLVGRVAGNVRRLRAARRWTQLQLAVRAGIEVTGIKALENADANFTAGTLARLAEGFEVDVGELLVPAAAPTRRRPGRPRKGGT